jgi:hypothetical protein
LTPEERGKMIPSSHPDFNKESPGDKYHLTLHSPHGVHHSGVYSSKKRLRSAADKKDNEYGAYLRREIHKIPGEIKKFDDAVMDAPMATKEKTKSNLKKGSDIMMASENNKKSKK